MSGDHTLYSLFDLAVETEKTAETFYIGLARRFSGRPDISTFWLNMAEDEKTHGFELGSIRETLLPSQLSMPADPQVFQKAMGHKKISAQTLLNSIRNLHDAYELACELEYSEVNVVFSFLMTSFIPTEQQRKFIFSEIKDHQEKIIKFFQALGGMEWRKGIAAFNGTVDT